MSVLVISKLENFWWWPTMCLCMGGDQSQSWAGLGTFPPGVPSLHRNLLLRWFVGWELNQEDSLRNSSSLLALPRRRRKQSSTWEKGKSRKGVLESALVFPNFFEKHWFFCSNNIFYRNTKVKTEKYRWKWNQGPIKLPLPILHLCQGP